MIPKMPSPKDCYICKSPAQMYTVPGPTKTHAEREVVICKSTNCVRYLITAAAVDAVKDAVEADDGTRELLSAAARRIARTKEKPPDLFAQAFYVERFKEKWWLIIGSKRIDRIANIERQLQQQENASVPEHPKTSPPARPKWKKR
jgi:hypothetical protein